MPTHPVLDSFLHHEEAGPDRTEAVGAPLVFLHGNPTSSHLWRHVLPKAAAAGRRCLAPDLIGMGRSGKPDIGYSFDDHARYLDAWFDALGLERAVLVGQDWGGALAFDRAARLPGSAAGVAFMETIVRPMTWAQYPAAARARFEAFRSPGTGEDLVLDRNVFIEDSFGQTVLGDLPAADHDVYRAPYPTRASRRPLLRWARSMPLDGEPADVVARVTAYGSWLADSPGTPKLLLTFDSSPTLIIDAATAAWCAAHVSALETEHCGPAAHLAPEDQPDAIAAAVTSWAARHGL
ncbi:putative haloalkane dehalogenase [Actinacidiphila reveromycinica]|uniref:Putative haloalkane dehalogenase n=1 Tax=Actinacidiphila reveromycinica TaxID=659352 RepID=A0A7U3UZ64_9ACTN|nr:haloalkane dehalogenase [Streptomyces sp. SN-593]BBB01538.1 putative haloalkane dehalogenase [Streptomyces sp. SN-593]